MNGIILGVDPGLRTTGYAVLERLGGKPKLREAGVIRTSEEKKANMARRLVLLDQSLREVVEQFRPGVMVVEQLYAHYKHPRTAVLMGHARGVILLAAAREQIPVVSYNPTRIKKTITGSGRAPKDQIQRTMQRELGLSKMPEPTDVADALAAALCHFYSQRFQDES